MILLSVQTLIKLIIIGYSVTRETVMYYRGIKFVPLISVLHLGTQIYILKLFGSQEGVSKFKSSLELRHVEEEKFFQRFREILSLYKNKGIQKHMANSKIT